VLKLLIHSHQHVLKIEQHIKTNRLVTMGVGKGILKILAKKVSFEWEKTNFATFGPPKKIWKISLMPPPGTNPSDAHACARIIVYFETEIKRTERNKQFVMSESTKVTKNESEKARSFMGVRRYFSGEERSKFCLSF